jgi:tetratricopeptide (TPR) repeat protein
MELTKENGLSVGMMVWNEAKTLREVVGIVKPVADQIIIGVDKKSDDGTQEIAKDLATDYFEFDFGGDFSEIRNKVLGKANYKLFLQLDGHEFLCPNSVKRLEELKKLLEKCDSRLEKIDALFLWLVLWTKDEPLLTFLVPRLLRTDRDLVYVQPIHNQVVKKDGSDVRSKDINIVLDHRENFDRTLKRHQSRVNNSIPVFEEVVKTEESSGKRDEDYYNLGLLYKSVFRDREAKVMFEKAFELSEMEEAKYEILLQLGIVCFNLGELEEAKKWLSLAPVYYPMRIEHLLFLAEVFKKEDRAEKAVPLLQQVLACEGKLPGSLFPLQIPAYTYKPYQLLMECYGKLGRLKEAIECGEKLRNFRFFKHKDQLESYLVQLQEKVLYSKQLGRELLKNEVVHHKDGDVVSNDKLENL